MNTFAKSRHAPQPVSAEPVQSEAQQLVLYRSGRQTVFPSTEDIQKNQLSKRLGTFATFVFPLGAQEKAFAEPREGETLLHSQIVCNQTRNLSLHVEAFERIFVISNIYAHPLVDKSDILDGHRLMSFAGTPIRNGCGNMIGTVCTVDTKYRNWNDAEIKALKEIAAQIEDCQLC